MSDTAPMTLLLQRPPVSPPKKAPSRMSWVPPAVGPLAGARAVTVGAPQSLPRYGALHVQTPVPEMPSEHVPKPLHALPTGPGHGVHEEP